MIRDELAPRLIGEDCFAVERCWELGYPVTFNILRDRRIGLVALRAVDLAIWDAVGRRSASRCGGSGAATAIRSS